MQYVCGGEVLRSIATSSVGVVGCRDWKGI
jgi:hypothetical protein